MMTITRTTKARKKRILLNLGTEKAKAHPTAAPPTTIIIDKAKECNSTPTMLVEEERMIEDGSNTTTLVTIMATLVALTTIILVRDGGEVPHMVFTLLTQSMIATDHHHIYINTIRPLRT